MEKKYNILMVDDNANNIQLAINILKQNSSYNIIFAIDGKSALQRVKEYNFDLILLDIIMEPMDGYEVCKRLKADQSTQDIPIIFLTARDDEQSIIKGFSLGAVDYITKPFFLHELQARVKTHLELKTYKDNLLKELELKDKLMLQQNKMATMGEMLENIAHQWRQPLSVITTASSGVKLQKEMGISSEPNEIKLLDTIIQSAEHLSQTIDDFRDFYKLKDKILFDIKDIFTKTMNIVKTGFLNQEVIIVENIQSVEIVGLDSELMQVLLNIINNSKDALKKLDDIKILMIDVYQQNDEVIFKIKDNAKGIDEDVILHIFEPYFTTKKNIGGTGIGLYMSQKIIRNHFQGDIFVQNINFSYNNQDYIGAEFTITIPLSK